MNELYIRNKEQAEKIIEAWKNCSICNECPLNSPEGWRCSYIKEQAEKYLKERQK